MIEKELLQICRNGKIPTAKFATALEDSHRWAPLYVGKEPLHIFLEKIAGPIRIMGMQYKDVLEDIDKRRVLVGKVSTYIGIINIHLIEAYMKFWSGVTVGVYCRRNAQTI